MRAICLTVLGLLASVSSALVRSYSVEPQTAAQSGWTRTIPGQDTVSQVLTINFDELDSTTGAYCELFAGSKGAGGAYHVSVRTYPGDFEVATGDTDGNVDHKWVKFKLGVTYPESIVKGKQLEFRFTRGGADSLEYYWSDGDPYKYGFMVTNQPHAGQDLAMRCMGRMDAIAANYWGVDAAGCPFWNDNTTFPDKPKWVQRCTTAGVGLARVLVDWESIERKFPGDTWFAGIESTLHHVVNLAGCEPLGLLVSCPKWASTRVLANGDTTPHAPPQNLFEPVDSNSNYYAKHLRELMPHCSTVHTWEILNEMNDSGPHQHGPPITEGWFHHPNDSFYPGVDTGVHGLCSLYIRLAAVAESVIRHGGFTGHENDSILLGGVFGATDSGPHLTPGWKWIDLCYEIAGSNVFWDGVSVHPYQSHDGLDPVLFEREAETLRAVMRHHGHAGAELWNTEVGWDTVWGEGTNANALCQVFVAGKASEALPQGGYDRSSWWLFRKPEPGWGHYPMLDPTMDTCFPSFYAMQQMSEALTGKRFNGRVMTGDGRDDSVRMYEFDDPATLRRSWVCWKNGSGGQDVAVQLPARSDSAYIEALAYEEETPPNSMRQANSYGWLGIGASERPQFITEPDYMPEDRPELVADSFDVQPQPLRIGQEAAFVVKVENRSNTATPGRVKVNFLRNDSVIANCSTQVAIPGLSSAWCVIIGYVVPQSFRGTGLFRAEVNPGQVYVESTGTDDNAGFKRVAGKQGHFPYLLTL
jgi:hypothetical protein